MLVIADGWLVVFALVLLVDGWFLLFSLRTIGFESFSGAYFGYFDTRLIAH